MSNAHTTVLFHADDFGITEEQARDILALSSACGGNGALNSVSIFANSPAFECAAALAQPFVQAGKLKVGLHLNLVEGYPVAPASEVPLLVNDRGAFHHNFMGLLLESKGVHRRAFAQQVEKECTAQLERFLQAFPAKKTALRIDSHQHTHAIPAITNAFVRAAEKLGCNIEHLRAPVEPLAPHKAAAILRSELEPGKPDPRITPDNRAKMVLLNRLWNSKNGGAGLGLPHSLFCGVALSAHMDEVDGELVRAFAQRAAKLGTGAEILFHPISVPVSRCLDPENTPFAQACASAARDREAKTLVKLEGNS